MVMMMLGSDESPVLRRGSNFVGELFPFHS